MLCTAFMSHFLSNTNLMFIFIEFLKRKKYFFPKSGVVSVTEDNKKYLFCQIHVFSLNLHIF
jgi:hypothetical protein